MRYNAGSEVYTQTLAQKLADQHEVHVFTREENSFLPHGLMKTEVDDFDPRVKLHIVNNPHNKDRYRDDTIDSRFAELIEHIDPDIVHIGHLNHLSTSLVQVAAFRRVPIVFTLHDFWLMCPRGQFMQMYPENESDIWPVCERQEDEKCADRCYARYYSGSKEDYNTDLNHWSNWVSRRMEHIREMIDLVDLFIVPSRYLMNRHVSQFSIPSSKLVYLDYGFNKERISGRKRIQGEPFTFGYIGTHIPAKGIHLLLEAFRNLSGQSKLKIWGRFREQLTPSLKQISNGDPSRLQWYPEYRNQDIINDVFNQVDALVVPSIWTENSPLVIHEAQQARIPVITADVGGMAEYVLHEINGLLFNHRSSESLTLQMQRLVDDPDLAQDLGKRGYLFSEDGEIPGINEHATILSNHYRQVISEKKNSTIYPRKGPWRITFDTNPDSCNLHCVMCEQHSRYRKNGKNRTHRFMPFELIEKVVEEAITFGLKEIIPSTMGEPLLYPDFERIIKLCEKHKLKLNLTTNGTFPRLGAEVWAEKIVPVASDVKISMNGARRDTQEWIMSGSNWETANTNIRTFLNIRDEMHKMHANGCTITLQVTFLDKNITELPELIDMAIEMGINRVKGHHVWTHFAELEHQSLRKNQATIARWNDVVMACNRITETRHLPDGSKLKLANFNILEDSATDNGHFGGKCPFLGQEAWINTEGRFDVCCAPDEQREGLGHYGNAVQKGLMDIWNSEMYQSLVRTYDSRPLCQSCQMRKPVEE